jgi:hypothetical protein
MRPTLLLFSVAIAVCLASLPRANATEARLPENVRTVLFLGDSITHAGWYVNDIETYFVTRRLAPGVAFIERGCLQRQTVSGLSEEGHAKRAIPPPRPAHPTQPHAGADQTRSGVRVLRDE